ncbi:MAG: hypothetical protein JWM11_3690 [Planctomycetaceae bacterium]|nr:hypothetical protein [Planctomycetaceae bacterium]
MAVRSRTPWITWIFAIPVLGFSLLGFGNKFLEFIQTFRNDPDGVFAITPVMNYLFASAGFFCLMVWAGMQGMFKDIEHPKISMLEMEDELNRQEGPGHLIRSITCAVPALKSSQRVAEAQGTFDATRSR